jgi:hypothetical protein
MAFLSLKIIPNDPLIRAHSYGGYGYILYDPIVAKWTPWYIHRYEDINEQLTRLRE